MRNLLLFLALILTGCLTDPDDSYDDWIITPGPGYVTCYPVYSDSLVMVERCDSVAFDNSLIRRTDTVWLVPEGEE